MLTIAYPNRPSENGASLTNSLRLSTLHMIGNMYDAPRQIVATDEDQRTREFVGELSREALSSSRLTTGKSVKSGRRSEIDQPEQCIHNGRQDQGVEGQSETLVDLSPYARSGNSTVSREGPCASRCCSQRSNGGKGPDSQDCRERLRMSSAYTASCHRRDSLKKSNPNAPPALPTTNLNSNGIGWRDGTAKRSLMLVRTKLRGIR
jgi:hypothetical protein